jgi:DNA polymerase I-like protein with 3'-5' exonuclease and polymerase domains
MIQIQKEIEARGMQSKLIGEIHDSILISCYPPEQKMIEFLCWKYMTQEVKKEYPEINVPLDVEMSGGEINAPWNECKEMYKLSK